MWIYFVIWMGLTHAEHKPIINSYKCSDKKQVDSFIKYLKRDTLIYKISVDSVFYPKK